MMWTDNELWFAVLESRLLDETLSAKERQWLEAEFLKVMAMRRQEVGKWHPSQFDGTFDALPPVPHDPVKEIAELLFIFSAVILSFAVIWVTFFL